MIKIKLNDVLLKDNIIYCLVIDLENNNIETFGNKDELKYDGLLKTHFYDMNTIYNLNDFLERQQLPKFKQGEVVCIICKPQSDIIVGLLYHEERNFMECYKSVKEINLIW
ncbi:hypothetical protein [Clostridium botulinum]|uniref:hypothetical protein n=1 Tax=Clostridium botulinum TaxID=1491 RepID=UPI000773A6B8|nr:hypothetical protein [Clostridium botulinum]